ncbi:T9SS type A sorting domain-containing protein [Yeosuana sp. MJ-SS3]|uniref:T9SS type A sorting domain-containing protein n=1 Tax=Gilvirhabdus luticola TaxID=3079858 RepID=A0ABU3U5G5_9FLAO|nr:T9SS type A sorting domain-containing protein [Yeosuana sp. MJ-SS3]MDU8885647.1 T9SS type A sorting domain-containing protein [Yeosuana sp. MJ-SS3]
MKKNYLLFLFLFLLTLHLSAQSNITFSVDMTGQTFTQAYVSGSFNGWSGTSNPLVDMGSGIWEATFPLADGEHEYKFTYDNWTGQEAFSQGDVCTITNGGGNHNRILVVAGSDKTLPTAPFSGCVESASNPGPHSLIVNVDMSAYGGSINTAVNINGQNYNSQGLGNWCGPCIPLVDMGSNIWSATIPLEEYTYEFKITVDGWTDQEFFAQFDPGTVTNDGNTNRYIQMYGDRTINLVWNTPQILSAEANDLNINSFKTFPNPTRDSWTIKAANNSIINIQVFDVLGKNVMSLNPSSNEAVIDGSSLGLGLYFAKVTSELGSDTLKLVKH